MAGLEDVRRLGGRLPQVTEGTFYGYRRRAPDALLRRLDD